jgi:hypothetical protein
MAGKAATDSIYLVVDTAALEMLNVGTQRLTKSNSLTQVPDY